MEIGDVVYLKSGSPAMTVIKIDEEGNAIVQWTVGENLTSSNVPFKALTEVDPRPLIRKAESARITAAQKVDTVVLDITESNTAK